METEGMPQHFTQDLCAFRCRNPHQLDLCPMRQFRSLVHRASTPVTRKHTHEDFVYERQIIHVDESNVDKVQISSIKSSCAQDSKQIVKGTRDFFADCSVDISPALVNIPPARRHLRLSSSCRLRGRLD